MAPTPRRLATFRMDNAAMPSVSAMATPAATTSARLMRGLGPRTGGGGSGAQSSSTTRRPSDVPGCSSDRPSVELRSSVRRSSCPVGSVTLHPRLVKLSVACDGLYLRTVYVILIQYGVRSSSREGADAMRGCPKKGYG